MNSNSLGKMCFVWDQGTRERYQRSG